MCAVFVRHNGCLKTARLGRPVPSAQSVYLCRRRTSLAPCLDNFEVNPVIDFVLCSKKESRVLEKIYSWGTDMLDLLRPYIPSATILTITCYAHIDDINIKVQIVLFSSVVIAMDDSSVLSTPSVRDFHRRLCLGVAQDESGMVGRLLEVLLKKWDFYPDFPSTSIFTSVSQFGNNCMLEQISGESPLAGSSDAMPFIAYCRNMSNH